MANKANGSLCTNSKRPFIKPRQQNQELISASALDLCKPFDKPKLYMYRYEPFRRNGKKKVAIFWTSYTCHIGFSWGILRSSSYTEVSYPFHHKHYFNNLHLKADCYFFPLLCSFKQESLLTASIKKIK